MLQAHQRTEAPSATNVSTSTAACAVTCVQPRILAPSKGRAADFSSRNSMRPGIAWTRIFKIEKYVISNLFGERDFAPSKLVLANVLDAKVLESAFGLLLALAHRLLIIAVRAARVRSCKCAACFSILVDLYE